MDRLSKRILSLIFAVAIATAGCRSFKAPALKLPFAGKHAASDADKADAVKQPDMSGIAAPQKMVALWTNTVYDAPGKPSTRGLAARVYFYDAKRTIVPVNGRMVVYAYDDSKSHEQDRRPDRKYVFSERQLASHYSVSEFGPSYSIWIPWDEVGQPQRDVSLVPIFQSADGNNVVGEHTQHVLPGPATTIAARPQTLGRPSFDTQQLGRTRGETLPRSSNREIGLTAFHSHATNDESMSTAEVAAIAQPQQLRTTSIKLPPSVQRRLVQSTDGLEPQTANEQNRVNQTGFRTASEVQIRNELKATTPSSAFSSTMAPRSPATGSLLDTGGIPSASTETIPGNLPNQSSQPLPSDMPFAEMSEPRSPVANSPALARLQARVNSRRRQQSTRFEPPTHQAPALPVPQPTLLRP